MILLGAALLGEMLRKRQSISLLNKDTVWPFVGTVIYGILVLKQPDMGTAAIIVALMVGLYILAGLRLREVVGLLGILGAVAVAGAIIGCSVLKYGWTRGAMRLIRAIRWYSR